MKTPPAWLAGGLLAVLASGACAQTLEATFLATEPALTVRGVVDGDILIEQATGELVFDAFSGFGVEPTQALVAGEPILYSIQDPATLEEIEAIRRIVGGYRASARNPIDAAGAQWAIWEVLGDGTVNPSFSGGDVRLFDPDSDVARRALAYLGDLAELPASPLFRLSHPGRQDLVTPVPEPTVAWLAGWLLAACAFRRRRTVPTD